MHAVVRGGKASLTLVRALELHSTIPATVQAAVHHGYVTLTGDEEGFVRIAIAGYNGAQNDSYNISIQVQ